MLSILSKIRQRVDFKSHFSFPNPETDILQQGSAKLPTLSATQPRMCQVGAPRALKGKFLAFW